jgi:hypothetical protein
MDLLEHARQTHQMLEALLEREDFRAFTNQEQYDALRNGERELSYLRAGLAVADRGGDEVVQTLER